MKPISCPKLRPSSVFVLLALNVPHAIFAAEQTLGEVTVTSDSRRPDLSPDSIRNPYRVEASGRFGSETLTQEDIEALAPKDVFDLLDKATGMNLTYQGRKSPFFLEERGGGSLTYILDGAILPSSANRILQKIPLAAIEQIEIVRGSTSLALGPSIPIGSSNSGSGVNTGFVIIRTRQPQGTEAKLSAFVEAAESQPVADGESLYLGTNFGDSPNRRAYLGGLAARRNIPSKDSWFDGQSADAQMLTGGFTFGRFSMNVMGYQDSGRFEMQRGVTVTGALDNSKWYYDPIKTAILSTDMNMAWSDNQNTILQLFKTDYEQREFNESFANATVAVKKFSEQSGGYSLRHNARFADTLLQFGRQQTESEGFGPNLSNSYNNWKTRVDGWSVSAEQQLFGGAVTLDAGYREDQKHIDFSATSATKLAANSGNDMAPAKTTTFGARWKINPMFALNGRYFDGKEGTSGDFDIRTQSGTPLHGTQQKRTEVALESNPARYFRPTLTWFDVDIKNQKSATTNTYLVNGETYYYYTESDVHRMGFEVLIKGDIGSGTNYSFAWTHMLTNETISNGTTSNAVGISSPRNLFTARLGHAWGAYRANLSVKNVGAWEQSTSAMGTAYNVSLGNYTRVDANVMRDFIVDGHKLTAKLYGRNLGNDKYATRYTTGYYYDRGFTAGLELSASF